MEDPIAVLAKCFAKLPKPKMENLVHHAAIGTDICCGPAATLLTNGSGGACPCVLASSREVPKQRIDLKDAPDWTGIYKIDKQAKTWEAVWINFCWTDIEFPMALFKSTQDDVRAAINLAQKLAEK